MQILTNSNDAKTKIDKLISTPKESDNIILQYEKYLKELEEDPEYKRECTLAINQFAKALERPDLYYHVFDDPKSDAVSIGKIGDIYERNNG